MLISKMRTLTQTVSFLFLTYGGRLGVNLGWSMPCLSCPYVPGCAGSCFLMFFQRVGVFGLASWDTLRTTIELRYLGWFVLFGLLAVLLSKGWCGWICPFGTLQDALAAIRRRLGIRQRAFSWTQRAQIRWVKYIFLALIVVHPFLITLGILSRDFYILFCKICPARVIMPIFSGNIDRIQMIVALDYTSNVTLVLSALSLICTAIALVGSFFKDRFFCLFCPMLPLLELFARWSPIQLHKNVRTCSGCGNCARSCPMALRYITEEKKHEIIHDEDCILCLECLQSCPENDVLSLKWKHKTIFASCRKRLLQALGLHE